MKNAVIALLFATVIIAGLGFSEIENIQVADKGGIENNLSGRFDTVPRKKGPVHKKKGTTPYDSFGKPKKMDSASLQ